VKIRIQVVIDAEDGEAEKIEDVARLERSSLRPEELGLTLAEARSLLRGMQQTIVTAQVGEYLARFASCPHCGRPRTHKGKRAIIYRTVFGKLNLASPRLYDCPCQKAGAAFGSYPPRRRAARTSGAITLQAAGCPQQPIL
jgi:hypothetical protein